MRYLKQIMNALLIVALIIIKIFVVIAIAFCFIVPPFLATAVICYYLPFFRENIIFELTAIVMFTLWLVVIIYVFDPIFDRLEDKWFRESAKEIVAYRARKWKAKLGKVDEVEDE